MQRLRLALQAQHLHTAGGAALLVVLEPAEAIDVDEAVDRLPAVAQLLQGADAQAGEREHAAGAQHPLRFAQHAREIGAPLQRQAGEQQVDAGRLQRQGLGITGDEVRGAPLGPGMAQHAFGNVHGQPRLLPIALAKGAGEITRAAAQVQPAMRLQRNRQTRQQLRADMALQFGHGIVARRRSRERRRHLALVRQSRRAHLGVGALRAFGTLSHRRTHG